MYKLSNCNEVIPEDVGVGVDTYIGKMVDEVDYSFSYGYIKTIYSTEINSSTIKNSGSISTSSFKTFLL